MRTCTLLCMCWLLSCIESKAQSNALVIVLPVIEQDICTAFEEMTPQARQIVDVVSRRLRKEGVQIAPFVPLMQKMKQQGGCDTHNPQVMLKRLLDTSVASQYLTVETVLDEQPEGNVLSVNISVYGAATQDLLEYQSGQSDRLATADLNKLANNVLDKIIPELLAALGGKSSNTTNIVAPKKNIRVNLVADVDNNLPRAKRDNLHAIAVVIGNANYQKTKSVDFALNDAAAMRKYLIETFGFKEGNIFYIEDALKSDFELLFGIKGNHKGKLFNAVKESQSDVFVFYAGHGAPGLNTKQGYLVPTDCDPQYVELGGYSMELFYQNLALVPAKSVTVVIDACFSGNVLIENVSPIVIKAKGIQGIKNGVLFSASSSDEVACWYNEKAHGLFTYYFLKAIHNLNADTNRDKQLTAQEIYDYLSQPTDAVPYQARRLHNVEQKPLLQTREAARILLNLR